VAAALTLILNTDTDQVQVAHKTDLVTLEHTVAQWPQQVALTEVVVVVEELTQVVKIQQVLVAQA
jgi:uncharacterized protein YheU (UPF0270 family)